MPEELPDFPSLSDSPRWAELNENDAADSEVLSEQQLSPAGCVRPATDLRCESPTTCDAACNPWCFSIVARRRRRAQRRGRSDGVASVSNRQDQAPPVEDDNDGTSRESEAIPPYVGSSPDDVALVEGAAKFGVILWKKQKNVLRVRLCQAKEGEEPSSPAGNAKAGVGFEQRDDSALQFDENSYVVLRTLEFTSERKRMSVLVRDKRTNMITCLTKGADSTMVDAQRISVYPCLGTHYTGDPEHNSYGCSHESGCNANRGGRNGGFEKPTTPESANPAGGLADLAPQQNSADETRKHLKKFAEQGLRTLVHAKRVVSAEEYARWNAKVTIVERKVAVTDAAAEEQRAKMDGLYEEMERNLTFVGVSAVEDKLQTGVPECIELLRNADITIWVLTGDKLETALNIGFSCKLLTPRMHILKLVGFSEVEALETELLAARDALLTPPPTSKRRRASPVSRPSTAEPAGSEGYALALDGATVALLLDGCSKQGVTAFLEVALQCRSCIGCRLSPKQKKDLIHLVKGNTKAVTAAIGDGANDVPMIREADVGVGIRGKEGSQAVLASDYALDEFRFLAPLLLMHGRLAYRRMSAFLCYYLYKNVALTFVSVVWAVFNAFSGQIFFAEWLSLMYNSVWTSWVCLTNWAIDTDLPPRHVYRNPKCYAVGQKNLLFSRRIFFFWVFLGSIHGTAVFLFTMLGMSEIKDRSGTIGGFWWTSCVAFALVTMVVMLKLGIHMVSWNVVQLAAFIGGFALFWICATALSTWRMALAFQFELYQLFLDISPLAWVVIVSAPIILMFDFFHVALKQTTWPNELDAEMRKHRIDCRYSKSGNCGDCDTPWWLPQAST